MIDIEKIKEIALKILFPIKPINNETIIKSHPFGFVRSKAGSKLPEHFLIYFLFSELLEFKDSGRFEKVAWSFLIDFNGKAFTIEYRKFGVGIFVQEPEHDEAVAEEIVKKINKAVKSARHFFDYIAEKAVQESQFNVINNNRELFNRFEYLLSLYKEQFQGYQNNEGKLKIIKSADGNSKTYIPLDFEFYKRANWLATSCIEAFFSWTEHLFIHLAIVGQSLSNGEEIAKLIEAEWKTKFTAAIPTHLQGNTKFYDELLLIRQQLRNFVAHGAFGKSGNAFHFHSNAGAVPVIMNHKRNKNRFSLHGRLTFKEDEVIKLIEEFISFLWKDQMEPVMFYTQECELPTILTFAADGTYQEATKSMEKMKEFTEYLMRQIDDASNMDW